MKKVILIENYEDVNDEALMHLGISLGISMDDCYEYREDNGAGEGVIWKALKKHDYAMKVLGTLLVDIEEEK